jgi:hypothetical protein
MNQCVKISILRSEAGRWPKGPRDGADQATYLEEGVVSIPGDGQPIPSTSPTIFRPSPLVHVAIPVPDEKIHQSGPRVGHRIHAILIGLLQALQQSNGPDHSWIPGESDILVLPLVRAYLDQPESAGKFLTVFPEEGNVRHHGQLRHGVKYADGVEKGRNDQGPRGVLGTHLVLNDRFYQRSPQIGMQTNGLILVDRAENKLAPIAGLEP